MPKIEPMTAPIMLPTLLIKRNHVLYNVIIFRIKSVLKRELIE
jgi:hypothetical protein